MRRVSSIIVALLLLLTPAAHATLPVWTYHITETRHGALLYVTARIRHPHTLNLSVDDGVEPFVRYVQVLHSGQWLSIRPSGNFWQLPAFAGSGATIRYQFDVGAAARHVDRMGLVQKAGAVYHVCPEAFLLRPCDDSEARVFFQVTSTDKTRFLTGYRRVGTTTWTSRATDLSLGPDAAFGPLKVRTLRSHGAVLTLAWQGLPVSDKILNQWVARQSDLVGQYFGGYPVRQLLVLMLPVPGYYTEGHARGGSGASVCINIGRQVSGPDLLHDTVLVHELVHVCTPALRSRWHWMEEGIATYLERMIPAQAGDLSPEDVWLGLTDDLPRGLPQPGDRGLNRTEDENRTYFGGALYWLLADVQIQLQSHGRYKLRDVMQTFHQAGASITHIWDVRHLFALSRRTTHLDVLTTLYADMAFTPYKADLPRLWKALGIRRQGTRVTMDQAPMSAIRLSLTPAPKPTDSKSSLTSVLTSILSDWVLGTLNYVSAQVPL